MLNTPREGTQLRIALALEEHNRLLREQYGLNPLPKTGCTKAQYVKIMKKWISEHYVAGTTLTEVLNGWYTVTREVWHGWVDFPTTGVSTGVKGGDNAGLICTPSTNKIAGQDDYAGLPLFACVDCNWTVGSETLEPVVTAIDGVVGEFERTNPEKFVGVLQQSGWAYKRDINANTVRIGYASVNVPEARPDPLPECVRVSGSIRPWMIHAKYLSKTTDGKLTCYSGAIPTAFITHNNLHTLAAATGTGYSGMCICDWSFLQVMFHIKYANLSADGILQGCLANNISELAAVSEEGVQRILLADGAGFEVGMGVVIGTTNNRESDDAYTISTKAGCIVTAVEDVTLEGTPYKAIYVDIAEPFDTLVGSTYVTSWYWPNGSCDNVLGSDGSPGDPTSGKYPAKLQGVEYSLGAYEVLADTIIRYTTNVAGTQVMRFCYTDRTAKQSTSIAGYTRVNTDIPQTASNSYKYITHKRMEKGIFFPDAVGGSSSMYYKDALYVAGTSTSEANRMCRVFGALTSGLGNCGLSFAYCLNPLTTSYWSSASRPSPNGNRGEFAA